ncbi:MAG TPA: O-antigen polysaccharide polymerase Wzy [Gammaproteobacteria bacterium]|nr:O-antigen polysaccharide polymerase Wzy [Gammaproteobacteria bacterium]
MIIYGAVLLALVYTMHPLSLTEGIIGVAIILLGLLPLRKWLLDPLGKLPIFESFSMAVGIYYGLPMISGENGTFNIWTIAGPVRVEIGIMIFVSLLASQLAFRLSQRRIRRLDRGIKRVMPMDLARVVMMVFLILSVVVVVTTSLGLRQFLGVFAGTVTTALVGLGMVASYVLARLAGAGLLNAPTRLLTILLIVTAVLIQTGSGLLAPAVRFIVPPIIGYIVGSGKVPWKTIGIGVLLFIFLNAGKHEMRMQYWGGSGQAGTYNILTLPERMVDWAGYSVDVLTSPKDKYRYTAPLTQRVNLSSIMGIIVRQSPEQKPYLYGKTYIPLLYLWIPRFFWPGKPQGHEANKQLVTYYNIQSERYAERTSIGVGVFGEAYANFGWSGVIGLAILFGYLLGRIEAKLNDPDVLALRSFLAAPFFIMTLAIEGPVSSMLVPLIQALIVIAIVFFFITVRERRALYLAGYR